MRFVQFLFFRHALAYNVTSYQFQKRTLAEAGIRF